MVTNFTGYVHGRICAAVLCLLLGAVSVPASAAGGDEDADPAYGSKFSEVNNALGTENWASAIELLLPMAADDPDDADVQNLLGYSHRKQKKFDQALGFYTRALELNPEHKGALEYLGELYLETDQLEKAEMQLAKLSKLCSFTCSEKRKLKRAIKKYKAKN